MSNNRSIRVRPIRRRDPDLRALARVLIDLVALDAVAAPKRDEDQQHDGVEHDRHGVDNDHDVDVQNPADQREAS